MRNGTFLQLPAAFWRLFAATLVNRLGGFVVPFLSIYLSAERGLSAQATGLVVAFFGAGAIVAGPFGGAFSDRYGRKPAIVGGMVLTALALLALGACRATPALAACCFLVGLCTELPRPATSALVTDLVPPELRPRAFAAIYWAANLGFASASLLAGLLSTASFGLLFGLDAATCLACAVIVALGVPEGLARSETTPRAPLGIARLTEPFRDRRFVRFFAATVALAIVFFQFNSTMALDMRAHGVSRTAYGALIALNGVLVIALQPITTRVLLSIPRASALALSAALTALGFGSLAFANGVASYAISITILTLGEVTMAPVNPTVVAELSPAHARGAYQGAFQLTWSIASCVAPILGGAVLTGFGSSTLWTGCLVVGLAVAAAHATEGRARARHDQRQRERGSGHALGSLRVRG